MPAVVSVRSLFGQVAGDDGCAHSVYFLGLMLNPRFSRNFDADGRFVNPRHALENRSSTPVCVKSQIADSGQALKAELRELYPGWKRWKSTSSQRAILCLVSLTRQKLFP